MEFLRNLVEHLKAIKVQTGNVTSCLSFYEFGVDFMAYFTSENVDGSAIKLYKTFLKNSAYNYTKLRNYYKVYKKYYINTPQTRVK